MQPDPKLIWSHNPPGLSHWFREYVKEVYPDHRGCFAGVSNDIERCFLSSAVVKKTGLRLHVAAALMLSWGKSCLDYRDPVRKWRPRNRNWVSADDIAWVTQFNRVWTQNLFWSLQLQESTKFPLSQHELDFSALHQKRSEVLCASNHFFVSFLPHKYRNNLILWYWFWKTM